MNRLTHAPIDVTHADRPTPHLPKCPPHESVVLWQLAEQDAERARRLTHRADTLRRLAFALALGDVERQPLEPHR